MTPNNVKHFVWSIRDGYRINKVILDFYMSITSLWLVSCFSKSNNFIGCLMRIIFHALSSCHSHIGFRKTHPIFFLPREIYFNKFSALEFLIFQGFFSYYKYKEANGKDDIKELVYEDSRSHLTTDGWSYQNKYIWCGSIKISGMAFIMKIILL